MTLSKVYEPISREFRQAVRQIAVYEYCPTCVCGMNHGPSPTYERDSDYDVTDFDCLVVQLDGKKQFVLDCECNSLRQYEDYFRHNRAWLLAFFENLLETEVRETKDFRNQVKRAGGNVPLLEDRPVRELDL
jgi:hypothetical protein